VSSQDVTAAKLALSRRLRELGASSPETSANEFINDLIEWGWQMNPDRQRRPYPARPDEWCRIHAGGHRDDCRGCRADQLAGEKPSSYTTDPRRDCDTSTEVAHLRGLIRKDESA
jgi:hypothetical protein